MPAGWKALPINAEFEGHRMGMYSQSRIGRPKGRKRCIISNDLRTKMNLSYTQTLSLHLTENTGQPVLAI